MRQPGRIWQQVMDGLRAGEEGTEDLARPVLEQRVWEKQGGWVVSPPSPTGRESRMGERRWHSNVMSLMLAGPMMKVTWAGGEAPGLWSDTVWVQISASPPDPLGLVATYRIAFVSVFFPGKWGCASHQARIMLNYSFVRIDHVLFIHL